MKEGETLPHENELTDILVVLKMIDAWKQSEQKKMGVIKGKWLDELTLKRRLAAKFEQKYPNYTPLFDSTFRAPRNLITKAQMRIYIGTPIIVDDELGVTFERIIHLGADSAEILRATQQFIGDTFAPWETHTGAHQSMKRYLISQNNELSLLDVYSDTFSYQLLPAEGKEKEHGEMFQEVLSLTEASTHLNLLTYANSNNIKIGGWVPIPEAVSGVMPIYQDATTD